MAFPSVYEMTNIARSATVQDDFSSDNWTDAGSNGVENGHLQLDSYLNGTDNTTYRAITELSDTEFVMKFSFKPNYTGYTTGTWSHLVYFGLASGTGNSASTQDSVTIGIETWSSGNRKIGGFAINNNTIISDMPSTPANNSIMTFVDNSTYYCKIIRNGDNFTFNIYSDSAYSTQVGTVTRTVSGITGLDTLVGTNWIISKSGSSGNDGTFTCEIDDVKIYNGVTNEIPRRQHAWWYFSGNSSGTINGGWTTNVYDNWSITDNQSYGSEGTVYTMNDEVDGGFKVTTASASTDAFTLTPSANQSIRWIDSESSVWIAQMKLYQSTNVQCDVGTKEDTSTSTARNRNQFICSTDYAGYNGNWQFQSTTYGQAGYTTDTTNPIDTDWHLFKGESTSSGVQGTMDNVLQADHTGSNKPSGKVNFNIMVRNSVSNMASRSMAVNYVECYNT